MARIYIAFVDTPGFFAALIRKFLKQRYVHVVRWLRRLTTTPQMKNQTSQYSSYLIFAVLVS